MASCSSMVESLRVRRRCYFGGGVEPPALCRFGSEPLVKPFSLVHFEITYTMPGGWERNDARMFSGDELLDLPNGAVPMMTPVYSLPYDGHPGACTSGMAYLIRTWDHVLNLPDVEARFMRKANPHAGPDEIFEMSGNLAEVGEHIFPLPIEDITV